LLALAVQILLVPSQATFVMFESVLMACCRRNAARYRGVEGKLQTLVAAYTYTQQTEQL